MLNPKKAILLYDGYCNLCIQVIKILEFICYISPRYRKNLEIKPFQKSNLIIKEYSLKKSYLREKIHLIDKDGSISKGSEAIYKLKNYFPLLKFLFLFFNTKIGKKLYSLISRNRYKIFGCNKYCYMPKTF